MTDFAIFIMVYGRPEKMWTLKSLRDCGYTGKIYLVGDDSDEKLEGYKSKYGDDLLVFSKNEVANKMDAGDNSGDLRSTMYAANTIFELAEKMGVKYFMICCDDYLEFAYRFDGELNYCHERIKSLDDVFGALLDFYKKTNALTVAIAQGGDFIGGKKHGWSTEVTLHRKAMNSFICSTERPFKFMGRLNEDVTTYVNLGSKGELFFTVPNVLLNQKRSQSEKKGLTDVYLDNGTYVKSFFSVMYNPSCVKVREMGDKHKRVHHQVNWNNAVPKIISEKYRSG